METGLSTRECDSRSSGLTDQQRDHTKASTDSRDSLKKKLISAFQPNT